MECGCQAVASVCMYLATSEFVPCVYLYLHLYVPVCTCQVTCMDVHTPPR